MWSVLIFLGPLHELVHPLLCGKTYARQPLRAGGGDCILHPGGLVYTANMPFKRQWVIVAGMPYEKP